MFAAAGWFFDWYLIALGLMFGRNARAAAKEAPLIATINESDFVNPSALK
jgi:hypothetical protein